MCIIQKMLLELYLAIKRYILQLWNGIGMEQVNENENDNDNENMNTMSVENVYRATMNGC